MLKILTLIMSLTIADEDKETPYRFDCSMGDYVYTYLATEYFTRGGLYWITTNTGNFYRLPVQRCIMWEAKREG